MPEKKKANKAEELVGKGSIISKVKRLWDPKSRLTRALNPERQKNPPQRGPSKQY